MRRLTIAVLLLLVAVALAVGLHPASPARTSDDYQHKAKDTAESVLSSVQTARLVSKAAGRGDTFGPYASVMLSESETSAVGAHGSFDAVQPPNAHSDRIRARLGRLLDRSDAALSRLRISARRGELDRLPLEAEPLDHVARQLEDFIAARGNVR